MNTQPNTKLSRAVHMLEGKDDIHRECYRLEKWAYVKNCWSSTRLSTRSCTWVNAISDLSADWVMNGLRAALWEGLGEHQWLKSWKWAGSVCLQPRGPPRAAPWLHQGNCDQQVEGGDFDPLFLWHPSWRVVSTFWPTSTRKTWICLSGFRERPKKWSDCCNTSPVDKDWESWSLFSLRKRSCCIRSVIKAGLQER